MPKRREPGTVPNDASNAARSHAAHSHAARSNVASDALDDDIDADLRTAPGDGDADPDADPSGATLTGELDLHTFLPRDCADVVAEYLRAAHEAGMTTVRIIHGKGTGTLRRIVHGVLERHPAVRAYHLAGEASGSWGATVVELHAPST